MKFEYAYRDRNNERHDGTIVASSKDAVFKKLRAQNIKPFYVAIAPGVANRLQSFGKRGIAIGVLAVIATTSTVVAVRAVREVEEAKNNSVAITIEEYFDASMRHQVMGDQGIIDKGIRTNWEDVFADEGDRFFAAYAIPGNPVGRMSVSEAMIRAALDHSCHVQPEDSLEVRQIKSMVEGLKSEARQFMKDGGTLARYMRRLSQRQYEELSYYQRAKNEIDALQKSEASETTIYKRLDELNASLRSMGIRLVTLSE